MSPVFDDDASAYTQLVSLAAGKPYDYNIFLQHIVYAVQEGHTLYLMLTTGDPYRCFLGESLSLNIHLRLSHSRAVDIAWRLSG